MKALRFFPVAALAAVTLAACSGPSRQDLEIANASKADSIATLRNDLLEQVMDGTRFVAEINKELARARSLGPSRQTQPVAEITDANEERKAVIQRINQLVTRLESVQARVATMRTQLTSKDSALSAKVTEYEQMVAQASEAAERQRIELQNVIAEQGVAIARLTRQVDTLTGALGRVTADHQAAYYVVGTREELRQKGVLVPEGRKRFLVAGRKSLVPAKDLDPGVFTRIDRRRDTTIVLPDGVYKIVSQQNGHYVIPDSVKDGKVGGAITIDQPERFWNTSPYLILVRS